MVAINEISVSADEREETLRGRGELCVKNIVNFRPKASGGNFAAE